MQELKCWPEPFGAVCDGTKTHEVRSVTDRAFEIGEQIILREWDDFRKLYTGRQECIVVTYISDPGTFGLPDDLAVLSIRRVRDDEPLLTGDAER